MQILRIEDPETHEALDLKEITSKTHAKAAESAPKKESTESKENTPATTESSTPVEAEGRQDKKEDQSESPSADVDEKVSDEEVKDNAQDEVSILSTYYCHATIKPACKLFYYSMDVTLRCGYERKDNVWRLAFPHSSDVLNTVLHATRHVYYVGCRK